MEPAAGLVFGGPIFGCRCRVFLSQNIQSWPAGTQADPPASASTAPTRRQVCQQHCLTAAQSGRRHAPPTRTPSTNTPARTAVITSAVYEGKLRLSKVTSVVSGEAGMTPWPRRNPEDADVPPTPKRRPFPKSHGGRRLTQFLHCAARSRDRWGAEVRSPKPLCLRISRALRSPSHRPPRPRGTAETPDSPLSRPKPRPTVSCACAPRRGQAPPSGPRRLRRRHPLLRDRVLRVRLSVDWATSRK